jgi:PKD repeat protein
MHKNNLYLAGLLVVCLLMFSCKKDEATNGTKAVFSYVADGYKVNFTNFSSGAATYFWDFNDGSGQTSTSRSPQHIFTQKGDYLVSLTAKNGADSSVFIDTVSIIGPNIKIDGDFSDWQYVPYTHENTQGGTGGTLLAVKTFASPDLLNFYIEGTSGMEIALFDMYIDADNNPATGFANATLFPAGSGADYLGEGPIDPNGALYIHSGPPSGFTFSPVASFGEVMNFSAIKPAGARKAIEFSIKKSALGPLSGFVNFSFLELTSGYADIGRLPELNTPASKFIAIPL